MVRATCEGVSTVYHERMVRFARSFASGLVTPIVLVGCSGGHEAAVAPIVPPTSPTVQVAEPADTGGARKLTLVEARRYMLQLINRDRASMSLPPVVLEDGPATRAGQAHAGDMAANGYLGHWGTDGSVPEQRFTEAGGVDMVLENASCFTDEQRRTLDPAPLIDPKNLDLAEDMFFHEQPPRDGHRKNILKPWHTKVGIGVAQSVATATEIPVPCIAQEFVDSVGAYGPVPGTMKVGGTLHVEGAVTSPATFAGVGMARVDAPVAIGVPEANRRRSYPVPAPYQMYWPPGFQTPIPVKVSAGRFSIDVPVSDGGKPGMYEVSVWARVATSPDLVMVSLRTIQVR
jgi:uncharacterized protein YkwD